MYMKKYLKIGCKNKDQINDSVCFCGDVIVFASVETLLGKG